MILLWHFICKFDLLGHDLIEPGFCRILETYAVFSFTGYT